MFRDDRQVCDAIGVLLRSVQLQHLWKATELLVSRPFTITGSSPPAAAREDEAAICAHIVHENANVPYQEQRARGNTMRSSAHAAP
jgi:hypothetical protein